MSLRHRTVRPIINTCFLAQGPSSRALAIIGSSVSIFNVVIAPYAAGLMNTTPTPETQYNLSRLSAFLPKDGRPMPSTVDPLNGNIINSNSLTWDQNIFYLSVNTPIVRELIQKTSWHSFAAEQLRRMDNDPGFLPPGEKKITPLNNLSKGKKPKLLFNSPLPLDPVGVTAFMGIVGRRGSSLPASGESPELGGSSR